MSREGWCLRKLNMSTAEQNDESSLLLAILAFLKEKKFKKAAKALQKELTKKHGDYAATSEPTGRILTLQSAAEVSGIEGTTAVANDTEKDTRRSSEPGKLSKKSKVNKDEIANGKKTKNAPSALAATAPQGAVLQSNEKKMKKSKRKTVNASSSSSSSQASQSSSSMEPPPRKKPQNEKTIEPSKTKVSPSTSPDEAIDEESGVSDVEVSDVSSVDVSSSDDDDDSGDESSDEDAQAEAVRQSQSRKKLEAEKRAKEAAKAASTWKPATDSPAQNRQVRTQAGTDGAQALAKGKPFQRVDSSYWASEADKHGGAVADNSYEGAFGSSGFGAKSSEKLQKVKGKDFRHEKTKRKRSFNGFARTGGQINTDQSFSTKFSYPDDD